MIINIHGFGGRGDNQKYHWLKKKYPNETIYYKNFDYENENPEFIFSHYLSIIRENINKEKIKIMATSWGGFFGYCLSCVYNNIPTILINPNLNPHLSNNRIKDINKRKRYLDIYSVFTFNNKNNCIGIIGENDELINHNIMTLPILSNIYKINCGHEINIDDDYNVEGVGSLESIILNHFNKKFNYTEEDSLF